MKIFDEFNNITKKNIEIVTENYEFIQSMISIFKLNVLLKDKEQLSKELEITEKFKQSSDIKATTNLLQKLNQSIEINKKKLIYLEEDYLQRKTQNDQFSTQIDNHTSMIQKLTHLKKNCFSQINKITREMSGDSTNQRDKSEGIVGIDNNLTNAQKIKAFQKKAKEAQIEIKEINSKLGEVKVRYEEFKPIYQAYKQDYNNLNEIIKIDTSKIDDLQSKLREEIKENGKNTHQNYDKINFRSIRSKREIEQEINNTTSELKSISIPNNLIDTQNPEDLSLLIKELNHINKDIDILEKDSRLGKNE
ncbi:MAG: hypothetical protein ACXAAH_03010, partial [Promethearchaeota archaeon]